MTFHGRPLAFLASFVQLTVQKTACAVSREDLDLQYFNPSHWITLSVKFVSTKM